MTREAVIALDQGSGSSRALAFDSNGRVLARAQFPIKTFYPRPGWVEHDPQDIAHSQERALANVLSRLPRTVEVLGIGIASQRSTIVLWDSKSGKCLGRALSWQDGRAKEQALALSGHQASIHEKTGLYLIPNYSAPKLQWLVQYAPAVKSAMEAGRLKIAPVGTYLLWRLTQGEVFSTDPSMAQRTLLFNIRRMAWDSDLLKLFGIAREALPHVGTSTGTLGVFKHQGRNIPILAMLGDQQAAGLGLGAETTGSGILNYGTGAFFLLNTGGEEHRVPGLLTSVAWQRRNEQCQFFQEGTVHAASTSFEWLKKNLGLLEDIRSVEKLCRQSKNRIFALNAIGGLGAPRWDYDTFAAFMGMNSQTHKEDIARAVTEGIAFLLADIFYTARFAGLSVNLLRASGGLSNIDYMLEFQSDLVQMPIVRMKETETTAMGVASLAAQEAGVDWFDRLRSGKKDAQFKPKISGRDAMRLLQAWKIFVETQQNLSVAMRKLGVLA